MVVASLRKYLILESGNALSAVPLTVGTLASRVIGVGLPGIGWSGFFRSGWGRVSYGRDACCRHNWPSSDVLAAR